MLLYCFFSQLSLGIIRSGHYAHSGGGGKYICLPNNPNYDKYSDSWENTGTIYGTEYEVSSFNPFTNDLHDHDAPCAVLRQVTWFRNDDARKE